MLRRSLALALATLSVVNAAASSNSICKSAAFQALTPTQLGTSPLLVRSLVNGTEVCLEFQIADTSATWFAVGLAASSSMVNSPTSNVMLYQASVGTPESYVLGAYSSSSVTKETDQSFFMVNEASTSPLKFSYQRTLAASSPNDVVASSTGENTFIWAYGTSWPISGHRSGTKGSAKYTLTTSTASGGTSGNSGGATTITITRPSTPFCDGKNCTAIVGGVAFAIMLVFGFLLTAVVPHTPLGHALLQRTLASPPVKMTKNVQVPPPHVLVLQNLADLRLGEVLIVLIFAGALAVLVALNNKSNDQKTSGQVALLIMMFLVLPVTRIPLWKISFGSSFERMVKFHRWLGIALFVAALVHLIEAKKVVKLSSKDKYAEVYPVWGTLAFLCFVLMLLTANEFMRRKLFDVFYLSHRVLSIVGFVFTILHCAKTIGLGLLVPLVLYALGVLSSWAAQYTSSYQATVSLHDATNAVTLVLNSSEKTKKFAQGMDMCSYFYLRVPSVSGIQWHPFSAIVTPTGDSIGFCIRAMDGPNDKTFTRALVDKARQSHSLAVNLSGPFGKLSVDVDKYDVIVLIGGGIGITPLLSALNQQRLFAKKSTKAADWNILWSVRYPQDLLMVDELMPTQAQQQFSGAMLQDPYQPGATAPPLNTTWNAHCSQETEDGVVTRAGGEQLAYRAGVPVLEEYINTGRYMGRKVAVLTCGPPTMVVEAQALARSCGFDFHKEVFAW